VKKKIIGLIPVRLKSLRLFEKPLLKLSDYPLFVHVYKRAKLSRLIDDVIVCCDDEKIYNECISECNFLFTYYTDIFNKIRKDEIDIGILNKFLDVLRRIEDGELDQHEGSFTVGTLLKELYVDSALKKAEKLEEQFEKKDEPKRSEIKISWNQYKKLI
jgi:hypothetical protein